jgi:hypothetical protein
MRSSVLQRRAARVRQDWSAAERARRAAASAERLTELIELLSGSASQSATNYPSEVRRRAQIHVAT